MGAIKTDKKDNLVYKIYATRKEMGAAAALDTAKAIKKLIAKKGEVNMIFAAAPSQNDYLLALTEDKSIDFTKINAFHMDEYVGLPQDAPQVFGNFLKRAIFDKVPFRSINTINSSAPDAEAECERYSQLLKEYPCDIVCMGIGENGHIAFNDPHVADFNDNKAVKVVSLDNVCRQQQVNDGCFKKIEDVPKFALTLTIPTLVLPQYIFCIVPAKTKASAVQATLLGQVGEKCPATVLRRHKNAILYLDTDSASLIL